MCYRIRHITAVESVTDFLPELDVDPQVRIEFSAEPLVAAFTHPLYPIVIHHPAHQKTLKMHQWGITGKRTINNPKERLKYLNARQENILTPGSAWYPLRQQRCLIPVEGIFEHREVSNIKRKIPYEVSQKGRNHFYLPGLYHNDTVPSFCIITTAANDLMKQIHNSGDNKHRMPLFMTEKIEKQWLDPALTDNDIKELCNFSISADHLNYHTVYSTHHNAKREDGLSIIAPYHWDGLPPVGTDNPQASLFN